MEEKPNGELAQLARALHWQCRGHRFESVILHVCQTQPAAMADWVFLCRLGPKKQNNICFYNLTDYRNMEDYP